MARFINTIGRRRLAVAVCGRCYFKVAYDDLIGVDPSLGTWVCAKCMDLPDKDLLPPREPEDIALEFVQPDVVLDDAGSGSTGSNGGTIVQMTMLTQEDATLDTFAMDLTVAELGLPVSLSMDAFEDATEDTFAMNMGVVNLPNVILALNATETGSDTFAMDINIDVSLALDATEASTPDSFSMTISVVADQADSVDDYVPSTWGAAWSIPFQWPWLDYPNGYIGSIGALAPPSNLANMSVSGVNVILQAGRTYDRYDFYGFQVAWQGTDANPTVVTNSRFGRPSNGQRAMDVGDATGLRIDLENCTVDGRRISSGNNALIYARYSLVNAYFCNIYDDMSDGGVISGGYWNETAVHDIGWNTGTPHIDPLEAEGTNAGVLYLRRCVLFGLRPAAAGSPLLTENAGIKSHIWQAVAHWTFDRVLDECLCAGGFFPYRMSTLPGTDPGRIRVLNSYGYTPNFDNTFPGAVANTARIIESDPGSLGTYQNTIWLRGSGVSVTNSGFANVNKMASLPAAPTFSATLDTSGTLTVTAAGGVATGYIEYFYRILGTSRWFAPKFISGASGTSITTGLSTSATYEIKGRTVNTSIGGGTTSVYSSLINASGGVPGAVPGSISDLSIASVTSGSITLTYTAATGATSHQYQLSTDGVSFSAFQTLATSTISGLTANTLYYVRIRGANASGAGPTSNTDSDTTSAVIGSLGIRGWATAAAEFGDGGGAFGLVVPTPSPAPQVGDRVLIFNYANVTPTLPAGWTQAAVADVSTTNQSMGAVGAMERIWQGGDVMPTIVTSDTRNFNWLTVVAIAIVAHTNSTEGVGEQGSNWGVNASQLTGSSIAVGGSNHLCFAAYGYCDTYPPTVAPTAFSSTIETATAAAGWAKGAEKNNTNGTANSYNDSLTVLWKLQATAATVVAPKLNVAPNVLGNWDCLTLSVY